LLDGRDRRALSVSAGKPVHTPRRDRFVMCDTPEKARSQGLRPGNFMNVFQNILYPCLLSPTRCSVSDTDRPQLYLVDRDAPIGIACRLLRIGKTGILWRGGLLNSSSDAVTQ
jgi:hypothetical protein